VNPATLRCYHVAAMKRQLLIVLLFSFISIGAVAQTSNTFPLIENVYHRKSILLNGDWNVLVDRYDEGGRDHGYFENRKQQSPGELVEYAFDGSQTLKVPGDWNTQRKEFFFYEGTVWYEKDFQYHVKPNTRAFLYVGAANYAATVYINGQKACSHEGGFTPFNCEIGKLLKDGANFAVISVENERRKERVPALSTDWWNYGGITRDVMIVEEPETFIHGYSLQLDRANREHISGWVQLTGTTNSQKVKVAIPELNLKTEVTTDAAGRAEVSFDVHGIKLWSPESPKLYKVEIESAEDKVQDEIGFRTVEVLGRDILLNGKPVYLRGISIHEEAPIRGGRANSDEDAKTLLGWAKELGCNYVRLAHYPHNEYMTREADRMGLLVWSEIPVYWDIDWKNPAAMASARQQLEEMIRRDHNKASIILWSVSNESPRVPERLAFLKELITTARTLDPTRLITSATNRTGSAGPHVRLLDDPLIGELDVYGTNEYLGWYEGNIDDAAKTVWQTPYDKPLLISEFGAGAKAGMHGDKGLRFTEEFQQNFYEQQLAMLKKIPTLRGMSPWVMVDFRSPRRLRPGIQDYFNRKGLISNDGSKKKAYYVLQKFYQEKAAETK
jgi:beta-glucuronidase